MKAQKGVVARSQAKAAGLTEGAIRHRLEEGLWVRVYPRVYASAGAESSWEGRLWAAVLFLGPSAVASHRSSGRLFELDGIDTGYIELTVARPGPRLPGQIIVHLCRQEIPRRKVRGFPVTSLERTLLDLGSVCSQETVEMALDCALRRRRTSVRRLEQALAQRRGRGVRGTKMLADLLCERRELGPTGSPLETRVARVLRVGGLPSPRRQHPVFESGSVIATLDFAYPSERVAIEVLGFEPHGNRRSWAKDFARHNRLSPLGWRIVYVTSSDLKAPAERILRPVRAALREADARRKPP